MARSCSALPSVIMYLWRGLTPVVRPIVPIIISHEGEKLILATFKLYQGGTTSACSCKAVTIHLSGTCWARGKHEYLNLAEMNHQSSSSRGVVIMSLQEGLSSHNLCLRWWHANLLINRSEWPHCHTISNSIYKIRDWMRQNKLKLNDDKTDIPLFSSNPLKIDTSTFITIGTDRPAPLWDHQEPGCHSWLLHVSNICKSANVHLYRMGRIRKYLTSDATQTIIHTPA